MIVAIDPGSEQSAWVRYTGGMPIRAKIEPNEVLLQRLRDGMAGALVIEGIASYGMPVGREVFDTCIWIGRFIEAAGGAELVYRKEVKMALCGSMKAKDANIRQALIDRYGPGKDKAVGRKADPGPLYGISKDMWSALALAVTYEGRE